MRILNQMNKPRIILASASPRRDELLNIIGLSHEILVTGADEEPIFNPPAGANYSPAEWRALSASQAKAEAAEKAVFAGDTNSKKRDAETIIIAADTVVSPTLDGSRAFGKPCGTDDAVQMLLELSGTEHVVIGGITVSNGIRRISKCVSTLVRMKKLTLEDIYSYIDTKEPFGKAGAYAVQGIGSIFVESIKGDYANVVGLSVSVLRDILKFDFSVKML